MMHLWNRISVIIGIVLIVNTVINSAHDIRISRWRNALRRKLREVMSNPLTQCHGGADLITSEDLRAPVISVPQAFHVGSNNTLHLMSRDLASAVEVMVFFKRSDQIIEHVQNCYTITLQRSGRQSSEAYKIEMDLKSDYLPANHIPGTPTTLQLVIRWKHDNQRSWYEDRKRVKTTASERVFIQTDKPVYKSDQTVIMRIYLVDRNLKPISGDIEVSVLSPEDVTYQKDVFTINDTVRGTVGLYQTEFEFPVVAKQGTWEIKVKHGHGLIQASGAKFDLQDYRLPTFSVKIRLPDVIPDSRTDVVPINITVRHVFGEDEAVQGTIECFAAISSNNLFPPSFYKWPQSNSDALCIGPDGTVNLTLDMNNYNTLDMFGLAGEELLVYCNATEYFTDDQASGQARAKFAQEIYNVNFERSPAYFKAGLPYVFQADVTFKHSGIPAEYIGFKLVVFHLRTRLIEQTVETDRRGQIIAILNNLEEADLYVEISPLEFEDVKYPYRISPQQGHALKVIPQVVHDQMIEELIVNASDFLSIHTLYLLAISNGKVLDQKSKSFTVFPMDGFKITNFAITGNLIPYVDIVAFYFDASRQPVVDTLRIAVQNECKPTERITTDSTTYNPADNMTLTFLGFHDTTVAPLMVDNAVRLMGKHGMITRKTISDAMDSNRKNCVALNSRQTVDQLNINIMGSNIAEECSSNTRWRRFIPDQYDIPLPGEGDSCCDWAIDVASGNSDDVRLCARLVGNLLTSQVDYITQSCVSETFKCCQERQAEERAMSHISVYEFLQAREEEDDIDDTPGLVDEPLIVAVEMDPPLYRAFEDEYATDGGERVNDVVPEEMIRKSFPESIVLPVVKITHTQRYEMRQKIPDSVTSWNIQAIYLNPTSGMCLPEPTNINVLKDVFLRVSMPYKVVRGEHVRMDVIVHNRLNRLLEVNITLEHVDTGLCYDTSQMLHNVHVMANSREYMHWYFTARESGSQTITIMVRDSTTIYDVMQQSVQVSYEGVPKSEKLESVSLGRAAAGMIRTVPVPQHNEEDCVLDSVKTFVKLSGNILGPNVEYLLSQLRGGKRKTASHGIRRLSSTLYAAVYLKNSNNLDPTIIKKIKKNLRSGVKDLLSFTDAGDAFRNSDKSEPSLWITAAAVKIMSEIEREFPGFTKITDDVICGAAQWLMYRQNGDGSFDETSNDAPRKAKRQQVLTAYISVALHDLQCDDVTVLEQSDDVTSQALRYLALKSHTLNNVYDKSHVTAAFARYQHRHRLGNPYAELSLLVHNITNKTREQVTSNDVETVANALIVAVKIGHPEDCNRYGHWLLSIRDSEGEFLLSKDTAVALEALAHYVGMHNGINQPSTCSVVSTRAPELHHYDVTIDPLRTDNIDVTDFGSEIELACGGESTVSAEVFHEYNTLHDTTSCFVTCNTTVELKQRPRRGRRDVDQCGDPTYVGNSNKYNMTICFRHDAEETNLTVEAHVDLLTQHKPVQSSLDNVMNLAHVINLETNHDDSTLFIKQTLTRSHIHCIEITTQTSKSLVNNVQPARITIVDEDSGLSCSMLYHSDNDNPLVNQGLCP